MGRWIQRLELGSPKLNNLWSYQELEEARNDFNLECSEGAWLCQHLDLLASRTVRKIFLLS